MNHGQKNAYTPTNKPVVLKQHEAAQMLQKATPEAGQHTLAQQTTANHIVVVDRPVMIQGCTT
jgi:hypothetical protein